MQREDDDHRWSNPICVFESLSLYKCKGCGAIVLDDGPPTEETIVSNGLPLKCGDESILIVIHEDYRGGWMDPWEDKTEDDFEWSEPLSATIADVLAVKGTDGV